MREHRTSAIEGFTKRYGLKRLIWYEHHDDISLAIQRERTMKHWPRAWKLRLILAMNADWRDLHEDLAQTEVAALARRACERQPA